MAAVENLIANPQAGSLNEVAIQLVLASTYVDSVRSLGRDPAGLLLKVEQLIRSALVIVVFASRDEMADLWGLGVGPDAPVSLRS